MFNQSFKTEVNPGDASANGKHKPVADKDIKGKSSFPGPDDNRFLNRLLQGSGK